VTDAVLVRAPVGVVYRVLTDLDAWPGWLDGCRSVRLDRDRAPVPSADVPEGTPTDLHALVLPGVRRPLRLLVVSHGWRHDVGMRWTVHLSGRRSTSVPISWSVEWWLEERRDGVVVHHLLHDRIQDRTAAASSGSRHARVVRRYRRGAVLALQALKDHLELAVAHAAGRVP
jgi:uncharacterized protein YndB with AHSA1/START domain